ncbi:MAG: hypothetical protein ACK5XN_16220 [Bacteroidota bacterium]
MKRPFSFKFSLLVSAFGMMALAGCNTSNLADKISGREGRKEQVVDGPRRAPLLNPQMATPAPQPAPNNAGAAAASKPAADNPFDQYDEDGNVVVAKPAKPLEMNSGEEAGSVDSGFFDRFIPSRSASDSDAQTADQPAVRKQFGRHAPTTADHQLPTQPVTIGQEAPASSPQAEVAPAAMQAPVIVSGETQQETATADEATLVRTAGALPPMTHTAPADSVTGFVPLVAPSTAGMAPAEIGAATAKEETKALQQQDSSAPQPSFFERLAASIRGDEKPASDQPATEPFPELSEIPQPPAALKQAIENHQYQRDMLENDHEQAQQQKKNLSQDSSQAVPDQELAATPETARAHPASAAVNAPKTVLLGRMHDNEPTPGDTITAAPQDVHQPDEPSKADATPWWKRISLFSQTAEAETHETKQQEPQHTGRGLLAPEPISNTVAPFKPLQPSSTQTDSRHTAEDVAEAEETKETATPDAPHNPEPSPARANPARDRQYYLVP